MSRKHSGRRMRDFSYLNEKYIHRNYLKYLKLAAREAVDRYDLTLNEIMVLFFLYDLEFFTIKYAAEALFQNQKKFGDRIIYPLQTRGNLRCSIRRPGRTIVTGTAYQTKRD